MNIPEKVEQAGVIGCGGAGFPTHIKLAHTVDTLIVNGAECEPLLYSDYWAMSRNPEKVLRGAEITAKACGAERIVVGIKEKNPELIDLFRSVSGEKVEVTALKDVYPSGDEHMITHETTGRVIPHGGLPLNVNVLVQNVITLIQVAEAVDEDKPATHRFVTIAGAVARPTVFYVPIGMSLNELIHLSGGITISDYSILEGGAMMGHPVELDEPIKKTSAGFLVLPNDNPALVDASLDIERIAQIARSVCDQCYYCTEMCPRRALGHAIEPHKIMRQIAFDLNVDKEATSFPHFCCDCGACSLYACPQLISPRRVITWLKERTERPGSEETARFRPSPKLINQATIPTARLILRLGLSRFDTMAELYEHELTPEKVSIPLQMGAGLPSLPLVKTGQDVELGDPIAKNETEKPGSKLHASMSGIVTRIDESITIARA